MERDLYALGRLTRDFPRRRRARRRSVRQDAQARAHQRALLAHAGRSTDRRLRVHRSVLQPGALALDARLPLAGAVRGALPHHVDRAGSRLALRVHRTRGAPRRSAGPSCTPASATHAHATPRELVHRVARELAHAGWQPRRSPPTTDPKFRARDFGHAVQALGDRHRFIRAGRPNSNAASSASSSPSSKSAGAPPSPARWSPRPPPSSTTSSCTSSTTTSTAPTPASSRARGSRTAATSSARRRWSMLCCSAMSMKRAAVVRTCRAKAPAESAISPAQTVSRVRATSPHGHAWLPPAPSCCPPPFRPRPGPAAPLGAPRQPRGEPRRRHAPD